MQALLPSRVRNV